MLENSSFMETAFNDLLSQLKRQIKLVFDI